MVENDPRLLVSDGRLQGAAGYVFSGMTARAGIILAI